MHKWYAIQSTLASKQAIMSELKKGGYNPRTRAIKDVLVFEFTQDNLDLNDKDDSLLEGYVLLKINEKKIKELSYLIRTKHVGQFFNVNKEGLPYSIPDEQVKDFKKKVRFKKSRIMAGQLVRVTEGILSGFIGSVVKKRALMAQISVKLPHRVVKRWVAIPHITTNFKE